MRRVPELSSLRNLGPQTEMWLNEIGIFTRADLEQIGSVKHIQDLKGERISGNMNLIWGIEGARADVDWRELPRT